MYKILDTFRKLSAEDPPPYNFKYIKLFLSQNF